MKIGQIESHRIIETTTTVTYGKNLQRSFEGLPEFYMPLKDVSLIEGGQAVFQCGVQGKEPIKVQWFKQNQEISPQFRYKTAKDEKTGLCTFLITTTLEDDAGQYSCRAVNELGENVTSAYLRSAGMIYLYTYILLNFDFNNLK